MTMVNAGKRNNDKNLILEHVKNKRKTQKDTSSTRTEIIMESVTNKYCVNVSAYTYVNTNGIHSKNIPRRLRMNSKRKIIHTRIYIYMRCNVHI